jgi:sterol desaturase/sphingolipid hydroxylase (fatty acid hydroxylase superfamily)
MRRVLGVTVFPAVFGGALVATWWLVSSGMSAALVVFAVSSVAAVAITFAERLLSFEAEWSKSHDDLPTDLIYAISSLFAAPRLFDTLALAALVSFAAHFAGEGAWWPAQLPWGLQLVAAVVIGEFGSYWWHRLMHERELLFRLHATHHSAPRLYWLNSTRFHPLDNVLMYGFQVAPLILLGVGEEVLVGFTVWSLIHGFFQHGNVDVRLGPLNYFFSMAELHRWHHSRKVEEANHNYGSNCIIWDLVFGTFYWPRERRPPVDIGLSDLPDFPQRFVGQLLSPFLWPSGRLGSKQS